MRSRRTLMVLAFLALGFMALSIAQGGQTGVPPRSNVNGQVVAPTHGAPPRGVTPPIRGDD